MQLTFQWPLARSYAEEDFILSSSNLQAHHFIQHITENTTGCAAILYGEHGTGKTHLAHIWQKNQDGIVIDSALLGSVTSDILWQENKYALMENIDSITDQTSFFHLIRHAETSNRFLLMTSRLPPRELSFSLPDLSSRLLALPCAALALPDDTLLQIVIAKFFADRQLRIGNDIAEYIIKRSERSLNFLLPLLQRVETTSLATRREITLPFLRTIMQ